MVLTNVDKCGKIYVHMPKSYPKPGKKIPERIKSLPDEGGKLSEIWLRTEFQLSSMQSAFVIEYLIDRNPGAAILRAGSKAKNFHSAGWQFLHNPKVQAALDVVTADWMEKSRITREWVLTKLRSNLENAEVAGKYSDVNKAIELFMKHLDMLDPGGQTKEEPEQQFFQLGEGREIEF